MRSNKLKPLVIGDITIEHPLALAPMAGVTDLPYRLLCKEQGAGMMCTEMVSAKGLYYGNRKSEPLMATDPKEIPVAIQIFGSDPEIMGQMAANCIKRSGNSCRSGTYDYHFFQILSPALCYCFQYTVIYHRYCSLCSQ